MASLTTKIGVMLIGILFLLLAWMFYSNKLIFTILIAVGIILIVIGFNLRRKKERGQDFMGFNTCDTENERTNKRRVR
jgi:hypothetical protein